MWDGLDRYQRFQLLDRLGAEILPVLVALPDVEVATRRPGDLHRREVRETVESLLDEGTGRLRRAVIVTSRVALAQEALGHVPPRSDPDTLTVPDHL